VLVSEVFLYDDLGMTAKVSGTDYGSTANQTELVITPAGADSPLGAGLVPGTVTTSCTAPTTGWAKPTSAATVAATVPSDLSKAAIFGYDTGSAMASGTAPARRVGWWQYESSTSGFTKESKALFDAAVAWASGVTPTIGYSRDATNRIVQRSVNGDVAARCSYTGSGDTSDLTLDSTGTVIEATLVLSGGVVFTWRNTAAVWSYPNLHGDVAAVTDGAGVKQGPTRVYAPFGQPLTGNSSGELDNSAGQFAYGWHGAAQRPVEHQCGTHALIEMGARPYDPSTGRFLQVDPIEGGTPNDYVHPTDPVNQADLDGEGGFGGHCGSMKGRKLRRCAARLRRTVQRMHANNRRPSGLQRWVTRHRGFLATIGASAGCLVPAVGLAVCGGLQAAAWAVRSQQRGYRHVRDNALDAGVTYLSFGLVSAPVAAGLGGALKRTAAQRFWIGAGSSAVSDGPQIASCVAARQVARGC